MGKTTFQNMYVSLNLDNVISLVSKSIGTDSLWFLNFLRIKMIIVPYKFYYY